MQLANTTECGQTETLDHGAAGPIARPVLKCVSCGSVATVAKVPVPLEERTQDRLRKGRVDFALFNIRASLNT
jgi:hypothetical protein